MVTRVSWVHFKPRKTEIGQKKRLTPFLLESLQLVVQKAFGGLISGGAYFQKGLVIIEGNFPFQYRLDLTMKTA